MWLEATKMLCPCRQHVLSALGLLFIIECIISLKLLELRVPSHVPLGSHAHLSCSWELNAHDVLYSVKWYKDGKEFFRYVPLDAEQRRKFPLPGVDIQGYDATGENLTLRAVDLQTSGRYRCEVSGEKPLFPTVSDHADLLVVVLPDHGPVLTGFRPRYHPGDQVHVTCTSGRSRPASQLSWYINGEPAPSHAVKSPVIDEEHGLETTKLMLDFVVEGSDFRKNGLRVKCLAILAPLYWRSNEESAIMERSILSPLLQPQARDIRVSRADRVLASSAEDLEDTRHKIIVLLICLFLQF